MAKKNHDKDGPPTFSAPSMMLGIDLGGTKILAGVVDSTGTIIGQAKRKTRAERGVEAVIERIARTATDAIANAHLDPSDILAVGIGAPGVSNYETGVVEFAPNLPDWTNVPLGTRLSHLLKMPVFVHNDVNAGTFGETAAGVARGYNSVVGIFPGTGIGGGIVLNGQLWRGARNAAAEIGHMVMMIDGPICGCGRRGCIEALASRTAIERDIIGEIRGGRRSLLTEVLDLESGEITSGVLADMITAGDPVVVEVVSRAARHLGLFTGSLVNAIDPDCIVFGGGLIEACGEFMLPIIREYAHHALLRPVPDESLPILTAALGDSAVLIGAAMLAREGVAGRDSA